jgi:hypothetical protein
MSKKAPEWLLAKIMERIQQERRFLVIRRKIMIFSFSCVFSAGLFVFAFKSFLANGAESGFFKFFSLLFSDFSAMAAYWKNFSLALLESMPIFELSGALAAIFLFLESLKLIIKNKYGYKYKIA